MGSGEGYGDGVSAHHHSGSMNIGPFCLNERRGKLRVLGLEMGCAAGIEDWKGEMFNIGRLIRERLTFDWVKRVEY